MAKISVLMPVYNSEKYLREAIDSILSQTYTDFKLVIINDGSTDKSKSIIQSYTDSRIIYVENEQNLGLIKTLNKGIDLCNGEFVARMDADDISMPTRFATQVHFLENNKECVLCGTDALIISNDGRETGKIINLRSDEYLRINLLFSVPFVHPSVMIRTNVLKEFRFSADYVHAEDYDLWCRVADKYEIANIGSLELKYRWHDSNVSVVNRNAQSDLKDKILRREIEKLGITAKSEDLYFHKITFQQYDAKRGNGQITFSEYKGLSDWFQTLIKANRSIKRYDQSTFSAYLWSRWIVLCISQKEYMKAFNPPFVSLNFLLFRRVVKLISFYSKK